MERLLQDLRYGARTLISKPSFTAIAVIALALGIGANTAIFSVVNALLLRPLPYDDPDRLVMVWHTYKSINLEEASISPPSYVEYRDLTSSFDSVATMTGWNVNLTGDGEPERVQGAVVTANFISTLGVEPILGRNFIAEEEKAGNNRVVIISHRLWQRRFAADSNIIDKTIMLNQAGHTIIGVMPAGFSMGREFDLLAPLVFTPEQLAADNHGNEYLQVVARLKPDVSFKQAQAEMNTLADQLREQFYSPNSGWGVNLKPVREQLVGDIRPGLLILLAAVGCVLLIACANVANLLLARATSRQKEIAIRTALGATRVRVIRQLLTESVMLSVLGGALGMLVAFVGIRLLVLGVPPDVAEFLVGWKQVGIDSRVLLFTLLVSVATGMLFGLAPAIQASKPDLNESLKEGGRSGGAGAHRNRARSILVVSEFAIALVLLIGAGLLIRSFIRLQEVNPGFNPDNVLTMNLSLPQTKYRESVQSANFYQQALEQVSTLPGVEAAGIVSNLPLGGDNWNASFSVEGLQVAQGEMGPHGDPRRVSPDYFRAMGIRLVKGRFFNDQDSKQSQPVAIIDETLAERYWPDEDPIGKRIAVGFEGSQQGPVWRTIVGVVGHVKHYGLDGKSKVQYYFPHQQNPSRTMYLVVRTNADPTSMVSAVRSRIQAVDNDQPLYKVMTMNQVLSNSVAQKRFTMLLLAIFAGLALLLAAVGIYGVMSYTVTQRTHEIGVRMALGAQQSDVMRLVVGQGMRLAVIGVIVGLAASLAVTRFAASFLFGVGATDPLTFTVVPLILTAVAVVASYIPARKAMKVDPMIALRYG